MSNWQYNFRKCNISSRKKSGNNGKVVRYGSSTHDVMIGSYSSGIQILGNNPKSYAYLIAATEPVFGIHAAVNQSTGDGEYLFKGMIYRVIIYECNVDTPAELLGKKFDFVPCYRKSDGEIGYYETVNGLFYTNQGSGVFGKGMDV